MSSLFSDLSNVRMPYVVMNAGPLPTSIPAEFGATTAALGATAASIYTGLKGVLGA